MYLFIDTETGGLTTDCSLLQLAALIVNDQLEVVDSIDLKVYPDDGIYHVKSSALAINKIDLRWRGDGAVSLSVAYQEFFAFLARHSNYGEFKLTPVGWNINFDLNFIYAGFGKLEFEKYCSYRTIDLQSVVLFRGASSIIPGSLVKVASQLGIDTSAAHDALADCEMTLAVFKALK